VAENVLLRDLNLNGVSARDQRRIEVVANGLPLWRGAQLAVDVTFVSPVRRDGRPQPQADRVDGIQLLEARRRKERTYAVMLRSRRCKLVVLAMEVGGRWSDEAVTFIRLLAKAKARSSPRILRKSVQAAFMHRWTGILSVAAQRALAATLLDAPMPGAAEPRDEPYLEDVLGDARLLEPRDPSRLPPGQV